VRSQEAVCRSAVRDRGFDRLLRTYAHLMPQEETDLSFADFGGTKLPYTAPPLEAAATNENAPATSGRGHSLFMEHETRFELATLTLARRCWA